jgi:hypothetical protein
MRTTLISGLTATIIGLGMFASAGSAYAAGCLQPDQTNYSLADDSDLSDAAFAADAKGFQCPTGQVSSYSATPNQPADANFFAAERRDPATVTAPDREVEWDSLVD